MRPVVKKKRRDPRYFLHESVEEESLSPAQKATMDTDGDGDVDEEDLAALRKRNGKKGKKGKKEHGTSGDKDGDGVPDNKDRPGVKLLKGEKNLYEMIRSAVEEVFENYLEEEK